MRQRRFAQHLNASRINQQARMNGAVSVASPMAANNGVSSNARTIAEQRQPRMLPLRAEGEGGEYGVVAAEPEQCGGRFVVQQTGAEADRRSQQRPGKGAAIGDQQTGGDQRSGQLDGRGTSPGRDPAQFSGQQICRVQVGRCASAWPVRQSISSTQLSPRTARCRPGWSDCGTHV